MKNLTKYQIHLNNMANCDLLKLKELCRYKKTSETAQTAKNFLIENGWVSKTFIKENYIDNKELSSIEYICTLKVDFKIQFNLRKFKENNAYD